MENNLANLEWLLELVESMCHFEVGKGLFDVSDILSQLMR